MVIRVTDINTGPWPFWGQLTHTWLLTPAHHVPQCDLRWLHMLLTSRSSTSPGQQGSKHQSVAQAAHIHMDLRFLHGLRPLHGPQHQHGLRWHNGGSSRMSNPGSESYFISGFHPCLKPGRSPNGHVVACSRAETEST